MSIEHIVAGFVGVVVSDACDPSAPETRLRGKERRAARAWYANEVATQADPQNTKRTTMNPRLGNNIILAVTLSVAVLLGFWALADSSKPNVQKSVTALRKLNAAARVGVSRTEYQRLLIDAKAATVDDLRSLPDGPLKTALDSAIYNYERAAKDWDTFGLEAGRAVINTSFVQAEVYEDEASKLIGQ